MGATPSTAASAEQSPCRLEGPQETSTGGPTHRRGQCLQCSWAWDSSCADSREEGPSTPGVPGFSPRDKRRSKDLRQQSRGQHQQSQAGEPQVPTQCLGGGGRMLTPGTALCPKGKSGEASSLQATGVTQLISFLFLLWLPGNSGLKFSYEKVMLRPTDLYSLVPRPALHSPLQFLLIHTTVGDTSRVFFSLLQ